jgi:hypothetical protein
MVAGACKRFGTLPPEPDPEWLTEFSEFVAKWMRDNLHPLDPTCDTSFERWIAHTNYPEWRREELRIVQSEMGDEFDPKWAKVKSFGKDETYPEYKHERAINARVDEFKCYSGPWIKLIEEIVYENRHFIKHVPVAQRPARIAELQMDGLSYVATDYTAFESLFTPAIMEACEFQLYKYMTRHVPGGPQWAANYCATLGGKNTCHFKNFTVELVGTRMSGEMSTSLGNGFGNLMFMLFTCQKVSRLRELTGTCAKREHECRVYDGVVEGDDGLFAVTGVPPSAADFAKLGLIIKLEVHADLSSAGFCSMYSDPVERINLVNPLEVVATAGWTSFRYARAKDSVLKRLLRCKALSMAHQYPGCPVVSAFAFHLLKMTRKYSIGKLADHKGVSQWERDQLIVALRDEHKLTEQAPGIRSRELMEELFGLRVNDQKALEKYFREKKDLGPIDHEVLRSVVPKVWREYFSEYSGDLMDPLPTWTQHPALSVKLPIAINWTQA